MTVDDDENPVLDQQTDDAQEGQEAGQGSEGADPPAEGAEAATDQQTGQGVEVKSRKERRFHQLTARMAAERQRADQAERKAADLQALIESQKTGGTAQAVSDDDIEARVNQRVIWRENQTKLASVVSAGVTEFGQAEWDDKTNFLYEMGAVNNPITMQAILDAGPKVGPKIVAALADDPDRLEILMKMEPAKMAREMGKIEAEVTGTPNRKVSAAPAPSKIMTPRSTPKGPDIYDTKTMSMAEYAKLRAKTAPRHLGGKGG